MFHIGSFFNRFQTFCLGRWSEPRYSSTCLGSEGSEGHDCPWQWTNHTHPPTHPMCMCVCVRVLVNIWCTYDVANHHAAHPFGNSTGRLPGVSELSKSQLAEICNKKNECVSFFVMCPGDLATWQHRQKERPLLTPRNHWSRSNHGIYWSLWRHW